MKAQFKTGRFFIALIVSVVAVNAHAEKWYQGGSLHGSTLAQWSAATERNKLATASDWIVIVLGENQVRKMAMLQKKARVVVSCIDTLVPTIGKSYDLKESKTTSVPLLCITQLESNNWK